jgi:ACS family hexuronate transporter-like MFS transporter
MVSSIPAILTTHAPLAIALISLAMFGYTGYTANTLAFPGDVFPKNAVGSIWGLASVGSGLGGVIFFAVAGTMIGHFGYKPVFIACGIAPLIALSIILFLLGPLRPDPKFQEQPLTPDPQVTS